MRYNRLGNSGLVVSELCLGAMTFGNKPSRIFSHELDQDGAAALVKQAVDAGVNFIDTANVYTQGQSEEFVGAALRSLGIPRGEIVIATKGMGPMGPGPNDSGTSRYHLLHHVDQSLKRLGLDPATSSAPFVATLVDVTGLIIYFGMAGALLRGTLL